VGPRRRPRANGLPFRSTYIAFTNLRAMLVASSCQTQFRAAALNCPRRADSSVFFGGRADLTCATRSFRKRSASRSLSVVTRAKVHHDAPWEKTKPSRWDARECLAGASSEPRCGPRRSARDSRGAALPDADSCWRTARSGMAPPSGTRAPRVSLAFGWEALDTWPDQAPVHAPTARPPARAPPRPVPRSR
jgi:hypothetical protein